MFSSIDNCTEPLRAPGRAEITIPKRMKTMTQAPTTKPFWRKLAAFLRPSTVARASPTEASERRTIPVSVADARAAGGFSCPPSCQRLRPSFLVYMGYRALSRR
jgi:hypothetical protein